MNIQGINNKEIWENFLIECEEKTFLDSWNWGEFQKKQGNDIWRLGIYDREELIGLVLVIKIKAKRGTFLFIPHGPVVKKDKSLVFNILFEKLKQLAKEEKADFIRISPIWQRTDENNQIFKELKKAPIHIHPEVTWELDISIPEEEILANMRKTTRYLIRQAEKFDDIEIIQSSDINDLKEFNKIYQETVKRHHFVPFSLKCLEDQFSCFTSDNEILIFLGKFKGEVVSSAIVVFWQNMAFYHHGASLSKYNKIPVSYLLQWQAIKEAKKRNCKTYNFWGISPDIKDKSDISKSKHPWAGLTLFKMGFGGYMKKYVQTKDFPITKKYYLIKAFEKVRKIKRRL